jgi:hypothetical protein
LSFFTAHAVVSTASPLFTKAKISKISVDPYQNSAILVIRKTEHTMRFYFDSITIGQEVAIDSGRSYHSFAFGTVSRITKNQIEVTMKMNPDKVRFSRVTGKALGVETWETKRLVTAADARATIARVAADRARQTERHEIKTKLQQIAVDGWSAETVTEVRALADRIQQYIGE